MKIRKMVLADYAQVYALWRSCPEMELNDIDDSESGVARFLARNPDTSLVAEEGERVVGVLLAGCDGRRGCRSRGSEESVAHFHTDGAWCAEA